MKSLARTVLGVATGAALPSALLERSSADNSLVPDRLDRPAWRMKDTILAPSVRPLAALSSRGVRDLVAVNDGLCPYGGALQRHVTIPAGVSTVRLVLTEVALQSGISSTAPLTLELRSSSGATLIGSTTYTPTATATDVTTAELSVTAGTEYLVRLCCNETGQSQFVCRRLRLEPATITDSRWRRFLRIDVNDENLQDSVEEGYYLGGRYPRASQFAHVDILTDANEIVVEWYDSINDFVGNRAYPGVFVDGYPLAVLSTEFGKINHEVVEIPSGGRRIKCVSVWAGPQAVTLLPAPVPDTENIGTFPCAIYVPQSAYVDIVSEPNPAAGRNITMFVDSKGSDYYSTNPAIEGIVPGLRRHGIRVVSVGCGGESIFRHTGATLSVDACLPLAKKLLRKRPDEVVIQAGRNDYKGGLFTPADLITQMGNLADAIHQLDPRVLVTFTTWTRESTEAAVSGVSWDAERDAILGLDDTRSGWCRVKDSAELWTSTDVATYVAFDSVHLGDKGQEKYARHIVGVGGEHPFSLHQLSSLFSWHEFDLGLPGGAPGAVTPEGSSPPTITLSGTSLVTGLLRIEIKTGSSVRQNMRFRWGIDGVGWAASNVSPAASVLLPIGITINFPEGVYANNVVYTAPLEIGTCFDRSNNGNHASPLSNQRALFDMVALGGKPAALLSATSPGDAYKVTGISVPAPYTVIALAQMGTAGTRAIVGRTASGTGLLLHSDATGTLITANDGTFARTAAATMTNPNLFILRVNGASSSMRVNGTQTTFSMNNAPLTGFQIGSDGVSSSFAWDKWIRRVVVCSAAISDGQCRAVEALCRAEGFIE